MTQEDKDLLLRDLCGRLPYGVKIYLEDFPNATLEGIINGGIILHCNKYDYTYDTPWNINYIKPYLFPLSSMTDEEKKEYCNLQDIFLCSSQYPVTDAYELFDWLNANHFDYRGLIENGLAIDATNLNIY
jgi:hypothetical protein